MRPFIPWAKQTTINRRSGKRNRRNCFRGVGNCDRRRFGGRSPQGLVCWRAQKKERLIGRAAPVCSAELKINFERSGWKQREISCCRRRRKGFGSFFCPLVLAYRPHN